jgi:GNAT superfamily N-acetyltransferase
MYVLRSHRRRGFGRALLSHLHAEAQRLRYNRMRLETGIRQAAAIGLYESYGARLSWSYRGDTIVV